MFEERRKDLQLWLEEKKRQVEQKAYASAQSAQYYAGQVSHDLKKVVDALGVAYTTSTGSTIATGDQQCFTT